MARLLVSVRSAEEALAAVQGGAAIIDVKEPDRGPLGRADPTVWQAVRRVVPAALPVSVALGELSEEAYLQIDRARFSGIAYRKIGLADAGARWRESWTALRRRLGDEPPWVLVAYADWKQARALDPDTVLETALTSGGTSAILVDTWDKTRPGPVDLSWKPWFDRARRGGLLTVLAGRLDVARIHALSPLSPDIFAIRGAACRDGDRHASIDQERVAALVRAASNARP